MPYEIRASIRLRRPLAELDVATISAVDALVKNAFAAVTEAIGASAVIVETEDAKIVQTRAKGDPEPAATTLDLQAADMPQGHTDAAPQANADDAKPAAAPDDDSGFEIPPSLRRGK